MLPVIEYTADVWNFANAYINNVRISFSFFFFFFFFNSLKIPAFIAEQYSVYLLRKLLFFIDATRSQLLTVFFQFYSIARAKNNLPFLFYIMCDCDDYSARMRSRAKRMMMHLYIKIDFILIILFLRRMIANFNLFFL